MKKVNQNLKDSLIVLAAVTAGILAVCGGGFADYANHSFWQKFWAIAAWVGFVVFLGGWIILQVKDRAFTKDEFRKNSGK